MIIEEIHIVHFLTLNNLYMTFDRGINLLEGDNESGKSSVLSFIRFIFYGAAGDLSETTSERALLCGKEKTGGSLTLSCRKGRFRVERSVDPAVKGMPQEDVRIIDLSLNSPIKGNDPAALFLGVSRELFERSTFMAQLRGRSLDATHLAGAVENMLSSADESTNAAGSIGRLKGRLAELEGDEGSPGALRECAGRLSALEKRLERAREDEREEKKMREALALDGKTIEGNRAALEEWKKKVEHTDALRALDRLRRAGEAVEQKKAAAAAAADLRARNGHGEFYPDRAFVRDLSNAGDRLTSALHEQSETERELSEATAELEALPMPPDGSKGQLLKTVGDCRRRASREKICFLVSAVAAVICLVLLVVFFFSGSVAAGAVFSGLALLTLAAAVVFFVRKTHAEQEELDAYSRFGIKNSDEIDEAVEKYVELTARRASLEKKIEEQKKRAQSVAASLAGIRQEISALAARWGRETPDDASLSAFISGAEHACDEMTSVLSDQRVADELIRALGDFDEGRVEELLREVENDGVSGEMSDAEYKSAQTKVKFYSQTIEGLEKRVAARGERLSELLSVMEDSGMLEDECDACRAQSEKLEKEAKVVRLALETLTAAVASIRASILPGVIGEASAFLEKATEGKYRSFTVSPDYAITVDGDDGSSRPLSALSGGTAELCYLALRLGVSSKLYVEPTMPYFFDESFAHFDDRRKAATFMALSDCAAAGKGQFFILACHKRDGALLEKITDVKKFAF